MDTAKKSNIKGLFIALIALVLVAAILLVIWLVNRPETLSGSKSITVDVIDNENKTTHYTLKTDEEYLHGALDQIKGLSIEGSDGDYGFFVSTVNGLRADYTLDGAYWSFYINGEYCMEGVDTQPIADGDVFTIQYELAQ